MSWGPPGGVQPGAQMRGGQPVGGGMMGGGMMGGMGRPLMGNRTGLDKDGLVIGVEKPSVGGLSECARPPPKESMVM
jgi:hypothetical protein